MENMTYEQAINRLDEIITTLENNQSTLDESIVLYQEAVSLAAYCDQKLKSIEDRVTQIFENNTLKNYEGDQYE